MYCSTVSTVDHSFIELANAGWVVLISVVLPLEHCQINKYNYELWFLKGSCLVNIVVISSRNGNFISLLRKIFEI